MKGEGGGWGGGEEIEVMTCESDQGHQEMPGLLIDLMHVSFSPLTSSHGRRKYPSRRENGGWRPDGAKVVGGSAGRSTAISQRTFQQLATLALPILIIEMARDAAAKRLAASGQVTCYS